MTAFLVTVRRMLVLATTGPMALAATAVIMAAAPIMGAVAEAQAPGTIRVDSVPGSSVTFALAFIPGGATRLGSPPSEAGRDEDEGPQRQVTVSPFWMTTTEVTTDLFAPFRFRRFDDHVTKVPGSPPFNADAVTRPSPPYEDPSHGMGGEGYPATGMTRLSALHFARWLSEKTGRLYRLPTEAEWEYVCKAGAEETAAATLAASAWFEDNSDGKYHETGGKSPNVLGVHDLQGNVAEWVMDSYSADAYGALQDGAEDPMAGTPARGRGIVRGGAFDDPTARLRCAERYPESTAWKRRDPQMPKSRWWNTDSPHVGFRLVSPVREMSMQEIRAYWTELLGG